ncbi:MAG: YraN family protein [Acidobacteria bacterium]|nr:YraN family protein [Acidobacteriota bacterium]
MSIRILGAIARMLGREDARAAHLQRGREGEDHAYFYLRKLGYTIVARNFRTHAGAELDLVGWERDVLCFIEVKTRSSRKVAPAEAAVDDEKRRNLHRAAADYLRRMSFRPVFRFDVLSIYCENEKKSPEITLFRDAFS